MTIADLIKKFTRPIAHEASTIEQAFAHAFGHGAASAVAEANHVETIIHTEEKELEMALSQAFTDALARIQAALSAHSNQGAADALTISTLQGQLSDLQTKCAAHEATIADLTQKLDAANAQIAEEEAAVAAIVPDPSTVPAPAPTPAADGSTSADVTP